MFLRMNQISDYQKIEEQNPEESGKNEKRK